MIRTLGETSIYGGKEYEFLTRSDGTCAIYSNQKKDVDNGFLQIDTNRFMKVINREELDFIFEKETSVLYKGDKFTGSVIEGDKIMLYTRNTYLGKKHNMIMRDKDEYFLYVALNAVDEIIQKWIPLKIE